MTQSKELPYQLIPETKAQYIRAQKKISQYFLPASEGFTTEEDNLENFAKRLHSSWRNDSFALHARRIFMQIARFLEDICTLSYGLIRLELRDFRMHQGKLYLVDNPLIPLEDRSMPPKDIHRLLKNLRIYDPIAEEYACFLGKCLYRFLSGHFDLDLKNNNDGSTYTFEHP